MRLESGRMVFTEIAPMVLPGGTTAARRYTCDREDGSVVAVIADREPFHDDGSLGLHVSVSAFLPSNGTKRRPTNSEVDAVRLQWFAGLKCEEFNGSAARPFVRHLWEVKE